MMIKLAFCFIITFLYSVSSAKFISVAINNEAPKLRGGSFAENSLSVNDDSVADGDFLDRQGNLENIVDDLTSNDRTNVESSENWMEKRLFSELSALKNTKYPLSMESYYYLWKDYKSKHGKKYGTFQEEKTRFKTYMDNHEFVRRHNIEYDKGLKTFSVALNKFSDMTTEEFVKTMNGFKMNLSRNNANAPRTKFLPPLNFKAPDSMDWREEGYVTPVKDQGHCGSCWAFSSTGALEGQHKRKTGTLISLSEQNLVDCSYKFGNEGCNGGLMDNAFQYIKQNHGVDTEKSYPYEAKEGKCRFKPGAIGADDKGFVDLDQGNETGLMLALASQGPISVAIDAGHRSFLHYNKGVYYEPQCSSTELDHGVLAIGYGSTDDGKDYWLIKNSWSAEWGEQGYVRIARNRDNHCGVASQASYPQV